MDCGLQLLHIVPRLFGRAGGVLGGAERYVLELARHMASEVPTSLVCFGDGEDSEETLGQLRIRTIGKPLLVRGHPHNPFSLRLLAELRRATVVHCHQQHIVASTFAALVSRLSGRKIFVSDLGGGGWDLSAYISTDRWYHGHLHISEYSRRVFGHAGKPWAHVILGGVDTEKFCPGAAARSDRAVVFVGRLMPHKGIDNLIKAIPPGVPLEIIGEPYDPRFARDLRQLGEGKQVQFHQGCTDQRLVEAYRSALCVVLPSVYRNMYGQETKVPELLGQTLLEGMACGRPVVCTDVASMPEVVRDGVTGFVAPPNNPDVLREKILWLRDHPQEADAMGQAARQWVLQKFTWPKVVRRCLEIYRLEGNGRNGNGAVRA